MTHSSRWTAQQITRMSRGLTKKSGNRSCRSPMTLQRCRKRSSTAARRWGHAASQCWSYRDAEGRLVGHVIRYDRPGSAVSEPSKEIKPFTFRAGPDGRREWRCQGLPHPRPLYRLDEIAARSDATVLVVEGEKAADAARQRFRDLVAMTSAGGNKAASKTDWTPLSGRHVTIWRDADDAGLRYEDDVAEILKQIGAASVKHVEIVSRGVV
jgi:putative DNA primase/helicase